MTFEWLTGQGIEQLPLYLTALAIGLLIGLDRERTPTAKAGLRTCALVALVGALSADLAQTFDAPSIIVAGLGAVALMMVAAYYHHHEAFHEWDSGTTTIAAVIACFLLGVTVVAASPKLAVILAVLITVLLHFKAELGAGVRNLDRRDLVSILQFAVVAFVVLPLLPDRNYGPYGALNPRDIWRMVVLISGVSLAGYIALRLLGGRHSNFLLGLFGGLVSSTATTLSYARKARAVPDSVGAAADVIITANVVLFARLAILATVVSQEILRVLAPVLGGALLAGAAVFFARRDSPAAVKGGELLKVRNPTELRAALVFAALYGTVVLLAAWLNDEWGSEGAYVVALITGFVDVDAIALSSLRLFGMAQLSALEATAAIVGCNRRRRIGECGFQTGDCQRRRWTSAILPLRASHRCHPDRLCVGAHRHIVMARHGTSSLPTKRSADAKGEGETKRRRFTATWRTIQTPHIGDTYRTDEILRTTS